MNAEEVTFKKKTIGVMVSCVHNMNLDYNKKIVNIVHRLHHNIHHLHPYLEQKLVAQ